METKPPQTSRVSLSAKFVLPVWGEGSERGDQRALFIPLNRNTMCHTPSRGKAHRLFGGDDVPHDVRCQKGKLKGLLNTLAGGVLRSCDLIKGFVTLTLADARHGSMQLLRSNNFTPSSEGCGARLMEGSARDQVALQVEVIVNGIVNGQKPLHRSR